MRRRNSRSTSCTGGDADDVGARGFERPEFRRRTGVLRAELLVVGAQLPHELALAVLALPARAGTPGIMLRAVVARDDGPDGLVLRFSEVLELSPLGERGTEALVHSMFGQVPQAQDRLARETDPVVLTRSYGMMRDTRFDTGDVAVFAANLADQLAGPCE